MPTINELIEAILSASRAQNKTCMYSRKELETFSQEKLNVIYTGILDLPHRRPWRIERRSGRIRTTKIWAKA